MNTPISNSTWVYTIIQNPGGFEQLVGYEEDTTKVKYIPAMHTKDDAEIFLSYMQREPGTRYEVQAIIYEDLLEYAKGNQFLIFFVDKEGNILEKMSAND